MKVNIVNAAAQRDPSMKPWLLDELVRNLKEMRDRSNTGDMQAAVTEFFNVFVFNDKPSCVHKWQTTQQGQTYADVRCETCGKTERQSWD
jgi:hypothetical protein